MAKKYIHVVIEEKGVEEELEYKIVLATPELRIAQEVSDDLWAQRDFDKLPRKEWENLKDRLDEYLETHSTKLADELDSDAELIHRIFHPSKYSLKILQEAEDFYENQDPYYSVNIQTVEYIDEY